jgi:hypothetical protein
VGLLGLAAGCGRKPGSSGGGSSGGGVPGKVTMRLELPDGPFASAEEATCTAVLLNGTADRVVIVPNRFYLKATGDDVRYVAFPGPALPPWPVAVVAPGGEYRHTYHRGLSDGWGSWQVGGKRCALTAVYSYTPELTAMLLDMVAKKEVKLPEGTLWEGELTSAPVEMTFTGK